MSQPAVSDPQLAILAEVAWQIAHPENDPQHGADRVGFNKSSLRKVMEHNYLREVDTRDRNFEGGPFRLFLTDDGVEQLRRGLTRNLVRHDQRESVERYVNGIHDADLGGSLPYAGQRRDGRSGRRP